MGTDIIAAKIIPGTLTICQSHTRISAISAAMAPSVIPKLSPIPAMIGMRRLSIRKELRPILVTISFISIFGDKPESGIHIAQMIMNMTGTEACLKSIFFLFFIVLRPPFFL